jgi:uncharacterized RDD family membrane protein YckC
MMTRPGTRISAFLIDGIILSAALAVSTLFLADLTALFVASAFVGYHTTFTWLLSTTPGKALRGLMIVRVDGQPFERNWRKLPWVFGRSSVGYLLVDVFGVGAVAPLLFGEPRPLHDVVFRTMAISDPNTPPRSRVRLEQLEARLAAQAEAVRWPRSALQKLFAWIVKGLLAIATGLAMLRRWGGWLVERLPHRRDRPTIAGPPPAGPLVLSTSITVLVVAVTIVVSVTVWVTILPSDGGGSGAAGSAEPTTSAPAASAAPVAPMDNGLLQSAPVPAMCGNPAGRLSGGSLEGAGGFTYLKDHEDFGVGGWHRLAYVDLTGDGDNEVIAVIQCDNTNFVRDWRALIYSDGAEILAQVPLPGATAVRLADDATFDVVGATHDVDGPREPGPATTIEARTYRLSRPTQAYGSAPRGRTFGPSTGTASN